MERPPHRFWAFVLAVLAVVVLSLPIVYTVRVYRTLPPFGTFALWTTTSLAIFAILTVVVSVVRHFVVPAVQSGFGRNRNGNL